MTVLWQGIPRHRSTRWTQTKRTVELLPGDIVLRDAKPVYFSGGQLHQRMPKHAREEIADNDG